MRQENQNCLIDKEIKEEIRKPWKGRMNAKYLQSCFTSSEDLNSKAQESN